MRFAPVLRHRCPRCLEGAVYASLLRMHESCPRCGLRFEREPGYFLGAMYYSYALSILAGLPAFAILWAADFGPVPIGLAATACIAAATPFCWRLSRVLWLHMDHSFDPR